MTRFLIVISLIPTILFGQNIQNVDMPMFIAEGTIMSVDEDFVNTGDVLNEGQLLIGRNWVNNGIYRSQGLGILELNGPLIQAISGQTAINRLRLSGGDKTVAADLVVKELELDGSKLFVDEGYSVRILESGTITRNPEDYIIGRLIMTGENLYPIGTIERFSPVLLDPIADNPSPIGIKAIESKLEGPLPSTVADVAPFHWIMDESEDIFNVQLAIENADFLKDTIGNAIIVQSEGVERDIISLFQEVVEGSLDSMTVSNSSRLPLSLPYFSIGRKFVAEEKPPLKVYNLVSANGDGINDFLYVENLDSYPKIHIAIYDRWGTLVFTQDEYDNREKVFVGNNNVLNTKKLIEGIYYYVIRYKGEKLARGFFELTR